MDVDYKHLDNMIKGNILFKVIFLIFISFSILYSQELVLGVVPQQSSLKMLKSWQPIAEYLSQETGVKVVYKTEKTIAAFEKSLYSSRYDMAYLNPYQFVLLHKRLNYAAKVRASKNIVGIVVADKIKKIQEFLQEDPTFLFPSSRAFAATLLIKYELAQKFNYRFDDAKKIRYVNSHDSVYKGVSRGFGDLGGGIERTFNVFSDSASKKNLNIVYTTEAYPSHPFAFHPKITESLQNKLINALIHMPEHLKKRLKVKRFIRIEKNEYKSVQNLASLIGTE